MIDSKLCGNEKDLNLIQKVQLAKEQDNMDTVNYWYGNNYNKIHKSCREIIAQQESNCFILAEEYVSLLVDSIHKADLSGFRERFQDPDILVIDGVDFVFSGKESSQEELLFLLRKRNDMGKTTYLTGFNAPSANCFIQPLCMLIENGQVRQFE
ncbi:MAG: hypothetical protein LUH07_08910 [Lachnospiraceae bacterium]|nr:hypothetical protein [Lachnospiraceae bacterium]